MAPVAWLQALTVGTDYCTDASVFGQRAGYGYWNAGFQGQNRPGSIFRFGPQLGFEF